jgi:GntR family transcriptional regulator
MALVKRGASQLIVAQDIGEGAIRYIEDALGIRQAGTRDLITVRTPDASEAAFFGLPDDGSVAVFEIVRTGFDEDGQPFHATVTTYPADRNQFIMTSGTVPAEHSAGHGHATTPS